MTNKLLLQQALDHVSANPGTWDQRHWLNAHGQSCLGGWALRLAGVPIHRGSGMAALYIVIAELPEGVTAEALPLGTPAEVGPVTHPVLAARALLDLTHAQASEIFYASRSTALDCARELIERKESHP